MPCCGKGREQLRGLAPSHPAPKPAYNAPALQRRVYYTRVLFQYTGKTALTVVSSKTGRRYRFDAPGARVEIDLRDRPLLADVPNLRQINEC